MMNLSRLRRSIGLLAIALPVALAACSLKTDAPTSYREIPVDSTSFATSLGVDLAHSNKTAGGVYYRDITVGTGDSVAPGARLTVKYVGQLANGAVFDASDATHPTFTFRLGLHEVIQGWDEGIVGMKVGGRRQLIIPSALGYGPAGSGPIPPYAVLVFTVDLIGAQ